ncbi:MAG TPA: hypothetical protein VG433_01750 [Pirellulales bacterium]|nr:hypothetical protein [Pirellulales bacterium]
MADVLLDDYRWLTSGQADDLLADAASSTEPIVQLTARLRRSLPAGRTHLVLEQVELRRRAKQKFAHPQRMFFSQVALEQATDEVLAGYKAERFGPAGPVADLCCGIGGDLLGLAPGRAVLGVDRNPAAAILASANLRRALPQEHSCGVAVADVLELDLGSAAAWHIDPDRRPHGRRTTRVALHSPDSAAIDHLRTRCTAAAIKLAPAAEAPPHWAPEAELEWISRGRECRQLVVWFDRLARHAGRRTASIIAPGSSRTVIERPDARLPVSPRVQRFVFEPDPAVLAADLSASLAAEHQLAALASRVGYLTGDAAVLDAALSCFEVLEVLPLRVKLVAQWLRKRGIGQLEIKKRGVSLEPEQLRRQLRPAGSEQATMLIAPIDGKSVAIMARRL